MKLHKLYKIMLMFPVVFMLGCSDFLDVNDTPNNPLESQISPNVLLSSGLAGSAFSNANELNRFSAVLVNYLAGAAGSPATYDIYNTNGADFGNQWRTEIYGGALISYKKMIEVADRLEAKAYSGIGKIMMAYTFSIATDVWGDVPYSEALYGDDKLILQPRLDSQRDIYLGNAALGIQGLFDMVKSGLADLDAPTTTKPTTDDIVYGGDIAKWRKAGNSLLLKLALQIRKVEPAVAATIINEVVAGNNYIKSNAENLNVNFGASTGSQNPVYFYTYVSSFMNDLIVSSRYVARLQALNDPRLDKFVTRSAASGNFVTIDNGFRGTLPPVTSGGKANWSRWSTVITGENGVGPVRLVTAAQTSFILAEAALTIPGVNLPAGKTIQNLYQDGIRASMLDTGPITTALTTAQIDTYFAANPAVVTLSGTTEQQLAKIIEQKYIALTGNGLEAWNDWRRTGYPNLPAHQNAVGIDGSRPVRAQYIDQEVARNPNFSPVHLPNERVWWDVD